MDIETWRWIWVIVAITAGVGEIFTGAFFMLPFAIGATAAAIATWAGMSAAIQWAAFFAVTVLSFVLTWRYMKNQDRNDKAQLRIGPQRFIGETGYVIEDIDPVTNTGIIRVHSEQWRASLPLGSEPVLSGSTVTVTGISGTVLQTKPTPQKTD